MNTKRGYQEIATRISQYIVEQGLKPGARLPSGHDLARTLSLGRSTVREALIALEIAGELEIRTGSGVYVCQPRNIVPLRLVPGMSPLEILQARMSIEGQIAADAALYAGASDVAKVERSLEEMRRLVAAGKNALEADLRFHLAVGEAAGNRVLMNIVRGLWDSMFAPRNFRLSQRLDHRQALALEDHDVIFAAIAERDPGAARRAMKQHLAQVHHFLQSRDGTPQADSV